MHLKHYSEKGVCGSYKTVKVSTAQSRLRSSETIFLCCPSVGEYLRDTKSVIHTPALSSRNDHTIDRLWQASWAHILALLLNNTEYELGKSLTLMLLFLHVYQFYRIVVGVTKLIYLKCSVLYLASHAICADASDYYL